MPQQTINLGTAPNDGTGDALRDAYDKCNSNFNELYAILPTPLSKLTQSGAVTNQVPAWNGSAWVPTNVSSLSAPRASEFCFFDSIGFAGNINLATNGLPAPDPTDWSFFRCPYIPTNFALYCWSVNCEDAGTPYGFQLQWSPDLTTWTTVSGLLDLNNKSIVPVQVAGGLTITGSPSVVYFRLIFVNTTGADRLISIKNLQISVWS